MALLVWTMVGLALWHFTVFLPDNFYGGIVGAFCGALLGSILFGLIVNLGSIPGAGRHRPADRPRGDSGRADRHRASSGGSACASCASQSRVHYQARLATFAAHTAHSRSPCR